MEDVVAIKVRDEERGWVGFMTWGRLWGSINATELLHAIRAHLPASGIRRPQDIELCNSLRDIRSGECFYEALLDFSWNRPPFGQEYDARQRGKREEVNQGGDIHFVGNLRDEVVGA